jgi:predicted ribosome quality control (RQC) complex YloA/Tae2 family protein
MGKLERIIKTQENTLHSAKINVESNKQVGDIISTHAGELQVLLDKFRVGKETGQDWPEITSKILDEKHLNVEPSVYFQSFDAKKLLVNVHLDGLVFTLQLRKTIFDNAAQFYQRSKRAKRRLNGTQEALNKTRDQLKAIESKVSSAQLLAKVAPERIAEEIGKQKIKKKEWFEKFRWFTSSDSFLVVAGKDAVSNEVLIKKYVEPNDLVFHVNIPGSPFVAIKSQGKDISEQTLQQSAEFAAAFSRGWREGFGSTDVYWVKPDQLSKSAPSGEYVTRGAFVVRGKRNWLRRIPLRLGIGVRIENASIKFIGGPIGAVEAKTKVYVTIVPGDLKGKLLVQQVLKLLAKKIPREHRQMVANTSIEEIRRFIPYNKGRTLEKKL